MNDPGYQHRLHQALLFLLGLYPIGLARTIMMFRTDKGRSLPMSFKVTAFIVPLIAVAGVLFFLLND